MIYADNAATTRMNETVAFRMANNMTKRLFGNASSLYPVGDKASKHLERARADIASCIGSKPNEIYFTSGGTESDNWALRGILNPGDHMITTVIEHPAILNTCKYLETQGVEVTYLYPDHSGKISICDLYKAFKSNTKLVSIQMINNEIGTVQSIVALSCITHSKGALFHTDAVQAVGHWWFDVGTYGIDMLSASGHKFNGPKGTGFLYVKDGIDIRPLMYGGSQELGLRPGTENVPAIVAMAEALKAKRQNFRTKESPVEKFYTEIKSRIKGVHINGPQLDKLLRSRLIINLCIDGVSAESLIALLGEHGVCISAGSACHSHSPEPSPVLKAIGLSDKDAFSSVRISFDEDVSDDEIKMLAKIMAGCIQTLRGVMED